MNEIYAFSWPYRADNHEMAATCFACPKDSFCKGNKPDFVREIGLVLGESMLVCVLTEALDDRGFERLKDWWKGSKAPDFDQFECIPAPTAYLETALSAPYDLREYVEMAGSAPIHHKLL